MSGLSFWSTNPIKRRIAESVDARSPGFYGVIRYVNRETRTVVVAIQGGQYLLYDVRYNTTRENPPRYIAVNCCVHIRSARGSKFHYEVTGPAIVVPTPSDGTNKFIDNPTDSTYVTGGLSIVPASGGGLRVCVLTGSFKSNGSNHTLSCVRLGENLNAKVTGTLTPPGIPKVGHLAFLGNTYVSILLDPSPLSGMRYDSIQIGGDSPYPIVHVVKGEESATYAKAPNLIDSSHISLAYISRRVGQTNITYSDIDTSATFFDSVMVLSASPTYFTQPYVQITNPITVYARDFTGAPLASIAITGTVSSGSGYLNATSANTNANGQALFTYTRVQTGMEYSPVILFQNPGKSADVTIVIMLLNQDGTVA